jgi:hypothetical protein
LWAFKKKSVLTVWLNLLSKSSLQVVQEYDFEESLLVTPRILNLLSQYRYGDGRRG